MIYSVWNQGTGDFEYFEDAKVQHELNVEKPDHLKGRALGSTIGQAAWPLPPSARAVGRGPAPIGRVSSSGGESLGDLGAETPTAKAVLLLIAAALIWKYAVPRKGARR